MTHGQWLGRLTLGLSAPCQPACQPQIGDAYPSALGAVTTPAFGQP